MNARTLLAPLLAVVAVAVAVPAESRAAGTAQDARAKSMRLVISPRPGQVVHRHRVRLRVRSRTLTDTLRVRLNGTRIGDDFGLPRRGMRTLRASLSHGLRRGRNVLRVSVRSRRGAVPTTRVRFVVRTRRHLVGAGRDRELAVDGKVRIRGAVRTAPRRGAGVKLRWRLVRAPRRNPAYAARLGAAPRYTFTSLGGRSASFRPRVPGRYTLRLSAGGGSRAASDTVTFDVTPRSRLVPIDTMTATDAANGDQRGIRVGDTTYLLRDAESSTPSGSVLQVLVLKRRTLEFVSNRKYLGGPALAEDLGRLDASKLVILVLQPGGLPGFQYGGLDKAVARIGAPDMGDSLPKNTGLISAIGVPGMAPGDADVNIVSSGTETGRLASMKGYVTPDQWGNYGFAPKERVPFTFEPKPPASCTPSNSARPCGGFRIRHLDARTLAPAAHDGEFYSTQYDWTATQLAADLEAMPEDDVVMIEAVSRHPEGSPDYWWPIGVIDRATMVRLANAVAQLGGTRNAFNRIAHQDGSDANGGMTYALVGWKGAGEGAGAEVAAGVDGEGQAPSLRVVLRPDRESRFRPVEGDTAPDALTNLVMQEPKTKWPLDDEPGAKAALAWLGTTNNKLSSDPRADYVTQPFDKADWDAIAADIEKVAYSAVPDERRKDFTEAEFIKGRDQLVKELRWVGNVRSYLAKLASPVSGSEVLSYATVQDIGAKVHKEAQPPDQDATMRWIEFAEILLELAGPITHEVSSTVAGVMELGTWMFGANEKGGPVEEVPFKASEFGKDVVAQMQQSVELYKRMGDIIVSDPEKLSFVGQNGGCSSNSESCPAGWSFSSDDITNLKADLQRTVERTAYEELLPLGFAVYGLNPERLDRAPDPRWYNCGGIHPFWYYSDSAVSLGTTPLLRELDPRDPGGSLWKLLVLSKPRGSGFHGQPPSDKALQRVFGPVSDTTSPDEGGLGVSLSRLMSEEDWSLWSPTPPFRPTHDQCS